MKAIYCATTKCKEIDIYIEQKNQILKKSARKNNKRCYSHITQRNKSSSVQYPNHLHQELDTCSKAMNQMMSCSLSAIFSDISEDVLEKWKLFDSRVICKQFQWISKKQKLGYSCIVCNLMWSGIFVNLWQTYFYV